MINPSDVYTGYGSTKLYGCWTNSVTKFDSSSFYNWEEDNLPILDLDERTSLLWERLGHPTSSVTGVALVVSGDSTDSCNSNIFKTLSSCLATLPEVINCPYLIEVASYGDIGSMVISNKVFGPKGSIEIINRNFSKVSPILNIFGIATNFNGEKYGSDSFSQDNGIVSSISLNDSTVATLFNNAGVYSSTPCIPTDFRLSKVLSLNSLVTSSNTYDSRITGNLTLFTKQNILNTNRMTAALAVTNNEQPFTSYSGGSGLTKFKPYDLSANAASPDKDYFTSHDSRSVNEFDDSDLNWSNKDFNFASVSLAYTNRLKEIKVYNCNGPIYIRNFTVDGGSYGGRDYGIDIRNSTVVIENCSVARANKAGLYADNSKVILTRGFVAYRNYGFDESGVRIGTPWANKVLYKNLNNDQKIYAAGIELNNSELNLSSTYARDYLLSLSAATYFYNNLPLSSYVTPDWLFCLSRNDIGLKAYNSKIFGGVRQTDTFYLTGIGDYKNSNLVSELNTEAGILLNNSTFDYSGRISLLGNFRGLNCNNSLLNIDQIVCKNNQKEGILLENSKLSYNKDCYKPDTNFFTNVYNLAQLAFFYNGTHLKLVNSIFEPTDTSSMPNNYHRCLMSNAIGSEITNSGDGRLAIPNVVVDNNSKLRLISLGISVMSDFDTNALTNTLPGNAISVTNNSELVLQGTKDYVTRIDGLTIAAPLDGILEAFLWESQKNKSGLYANNNSTIKIQGPTFINQFGVDILVDNNSNLEITPHKDSNNRYALEKFDLEDGRNHTIVELHSSRACIVANNRSNVLIKDLGSFDQIWSRTVNGNSVLTGSSVDVITTNETELISGYITGSGCIQFYPNPNSYTSYLSDNIASNRLNITSVYNSPISVTMNSTVSAGYIWSSGQYYGNNTNNNLFSSVTNGGVCVRALGSSKIDIDNVHFPCGWWVPSGVIYETNGAEGLCGRPFIWNIADDSQLHARLVSVSGLYPYDTAYVGPSGTWGNASGAPATTPDTGSVSILDYYGQASNHRYRSTTAQNKGPFRLYFSIDPAINNASAIGTSGLIGFMPQVYAQGYQFSGDLTFGDIEKDYYKSIMYPSSVSSYVASGFYYASAIISNPRTVNVLLDESAANLFANAKHNSVGKSGLAKKVAIYFPYDEYSGGEALEGDKKSRGSGFKSTNIFDLNKDN